MIAGAKVTGRNLATNQSVENSTNNNGIYRLGTLQPGSYEITVEATGFQRLVVGGVDISVGQSATLNATLSVGALTETVTVFNQTSPVDPAKTEVSEIVDRVRIAELPISGRQFIDFALLTPNTVVGKGISLGASSPLVEDVPRISFGGLFEQHSNYFALDGGDHTVSLNGFQHNGPSQEAVQEFRVLSSSYSVEYGRAMGGIVNIITRAGTNDVHGSAYYFLRNSSLDATNILSAPGFDTLRQQQYGVSLGGPITKNRFFYFGNYEGQRRRESPLYSRYILDNISAINRAKRSLGLSEEVLNKLQTKDYDYLLLRADSSLSSGTHLFARYNFANQRSENAPSVPGGLGGPSTFRKNDVLSQSLMANLTALIRPNLVNQGFIQFSRKAFSNDPLSLEPNLEIPNIATFGKHIGPADFYRENRFQVSDNLSFSVGNHDLSVGSSVDFISDRIIWSLTVPGLAVFTPESFLGLPPFGQATPVFFSFGVPRNQLGGGLPTRDTSRLFPDATFESAATTAYSHRLFEFFAQDRWQRRQLTLVYGVRYLLETVADFGIKTDKNNFQPRVGMSYGFSSGRGVIRAGAGIFTAPHFWSRLVNQLTCVGGGARDIALIEPGRASLFS